MSAWLGMGAGLAKHYLEDAPQQQQMAQAQAEMQKYQPLTEVGGNFTPAPSAFASMMQGGMTGAMMGQMGKKAAAGNQEQGATPFVPGGGSEYTIPYHNQKNPWDVNL